MSLAYRQAGYELGMKEQKQERKKKFSFYLKWIMKKFLKKLIWYEKIYNIIKDSFIYQARKKLNGQIANLLYGYPSKHFFVIGVTWTNGKTTVVNLIHKILNDNVAKTVMVSTANIKIVNRNIPNEKKMTSLDIYDLQSILAMAKGSGCKIAVLETSSHWLNQYRFEWIQFDFAVLTNITHDHLDYHWTRDKYIQAKEGLFKYVMNSKKSNKYAIFPMDDKIGRKWFDEMNFDKKLGFSIVSSSNLKAEEIYQSLTWTHFKFSYLWKTYEVKTKLLWKFNVYNILTALGVALEIWVDMSLAIKSIENFDPVVWRMEHLQVNGIDCFVDFAHSPDALEKTLSYFVDIKWPGRLITVFGAPWNRDKLKRPIMWEIVSQYSDIMIATDDDPDTENRFSILKQLTENVKNKVEWKDFFIIPERTLAIKFAMEMAKPGDIVMFAGKWHETIQLTNFGKRPWSDKEEILKSIKNYKIK